MVKPRVSHEFTLWCWNEHKNDSNNLDNIALLRKGANSIEEKIEWGDKFSKMDNNWNLKTI